MGRIQSQGWNKELIMELGEVELGKFFIMEVKEGGEF